MFKLALALVLSSIAVGCVESGSGQDVASPPTVGSPAIPGDPSPAVMHHEARTSAVRDPEPRDYVVRPREFVECWQCRR